VGRLGNVFVHAGIWLGLGLVFYVFFLRQEAPPVQVVGPDRVELAAGGTAISISTAPSRASPCASSSTPAPAPFPSPGDSPTGIGLGCDIPSTFRTANGLVQGCTSRVAALDFGPFRVENLAVAILPNLTSDALLGMNALRHVRMEQVGDKLRLGRGE
jgi:hypothetical protein